MGIFDKFKRKASVATVVEEVATQQVQNEIEKIDVSEIKNRLRKSATIFKTGGVRPYDNNYDSWIGNIASSLPNEKAPKDADGKEMYPLAMFFLNAIPYVPDCLKGINRLCIYISESIHDHYNKGYKGYYSVQSFDDINGLERSQIISEHIKSFPLVTQLIENDYPAWDGGGIPLDIEDEILRLEDEIGLDYYDDIVEDEYNVHKIGGYPSFIQSGIDFGGDFEFALQITSDDKAYLNIVDSGNFYFYRNVKTSEWKLHCDFY